MDLTFFSDSQREYLARLGLRHPPIEFAVGDSQFSWAVAFAPAIVALTNHDLNISPTNYSDALYCLTARRADSAALTDNIFFGCFAFALELTGVQIFARINSLRSLVGLVPKTWSFTAHEGPRGRKIRNEKFARQYLLDITTAVQNCDAKLVADRKIYYPHREHTDEQIAAKVQAQVHRYQRTHPHRPQPSVPKPDSDERAAAWTKVRPAADSCRDLPVDKFVHNDLTRRFDELDKPLDVEQAVSCLLLFNEQAIRDRDRYLSACGPELVRAIGRYKENKGLAKDCLLPSDVERTIAYNIFLHTFHPSLPKHLADFKLPFEFRRLIDFDQPQDIPHPTLAAQYSIFRSPAPLRHDEKAVQIEYDIIRHCERLALDNNHRLLPLLQLSPDRQTRLLRADRFDRILQHYVRDLSEGAAFNLSDLRAISNVPLQLRAIGLAVRDTLVEDTTFQLWSPLPPSTMPGATADALNADGSHRFRPWKYDDETSIDTKSRSHEMGHKESDQNAVVKTQRLYAAMAARVMPGRLPPINVQLEDITVFELLQLAFQDKRYAKAWLAANWDGVFNAAGLPQPNRRQKGRPAIVNVPDVGYRYVTILGVYTLCGEGHLLKLFEGRMDALAMTKKANEGDQWPWCRPGRRDFAESYTSNNKTEALFGYDEDLTVDWDAIKWPVEVDYDRLSKTFESSFDDDTLSRPREVVDLWFNLPERPPKPLPNESRPKPRKYCRERRLSFYHSVDRPMQGFFLPQVDDDGIPFKLPSNCTPNKLDNVYQDDQPVQFKKRARTMINATDDLDSITAGWYDNPSTPDEPQNSESGSTSIQATPSQTQMDIESRRTSKGKAKQTNIYNVDKVGSTSKALHASTPTPSRFTQILATTHFDPKSTSKYTDSDRGNDTGRKTKVPRTSGSTASAPPTTQSVMDVDTGAQYVAPCVGMNQALAVTAQIGCSALREQSYEAFVRSRAPESEIADLTNRLNRAKTLYRYERHQADTLMGAAQYIYALSAEAAVTNAKAAIHLGAPVNLNDANHVPRALAEDQIADLTDMRWNDRDPNIHREWSAFAEKITRPETDFEYPSMTEDTGLTQNDMEQMTGEEFAEPWSQFAPQGTPSHFPTTRAVALDAYRYSDYDPARQAQDIRQRSQKQPTDTSRTANSSIEIDAKTEQKQQTTAPTANASPEIVPKQKTMISTTNTSPDVMQSSGSGPSTPHSRTQPRPNQRHQASSGVQLERPTQSAPSSDQTEDQALSDPYQATPRRGRGNVRGRPNVRATPTPRSRPGGRARNRATSTRAVDSAHMSKKRQHEE